MAIKNEQSRHTGNIGHMSNKTKKDNTENQKDEQHAPPQRLWGDIQVPRFLLIPRDTTIKSVHKMNILVSKEN